MQYVVQFYYSRFIFCYRKRRSNVDVTQAQVKEMFQLGFTITQIAARFCVSSPTVYKLLSDAGIEHSQRFIVVNDNELDIIIREIKEACPNAGEVNVIGHLRARKINVQRQRVRASIHRVDPQGPSERSTRNFHRRV